MDEFLCLGAAPELTKNSGLAQSYFVLGASTEIILISEYLFVRIMKMLGMTKSCLGKATSTIRVVLTHHEGLREDSVALNQLQRHPSRISDSAYTRWKRR